MQTLFFKTIRQDKKAASFDTDRLPSPVTRLGDGQMNIDFTLCLAP